jgi:hypothetical protein
LKSGLQILFIFKFEMRKLTSRTAGHGANISNS